MIDVKTIIKPKGAANGAAPTGAAQAGRAVRTADEALHAAHADRAGKAGRADSAAYADKAGDAQTARWAAVTDAVRGEFLSSKADDAAEGIITFLKGLLLGDGTRGIDADGNATLGGVTAEAADIARAAIRRMTSDVAFERLATFARGLVATMIESPGYEAGSRGFGLHKTEGGRYRLEVDELMVRVPCHRGAWQAGIRYSYYDQVGHAGGLWLCVATGGTESEPGHGGGWEQQVAPGKDGTPGRDGADNAVRAWLSPVSLVATETAPGVFELSESVLALNVVRGTGDDITGECRVVSARGMGCTASVDDVDTVEVTGATGDGGTIAVVAGVALPGGGVVECRADYAINRLGTFRETIENDVKRQVAQREFAYSDADGRLHTVAGMSAVAQSAEQVRQEVWRRQPAGSVVANGTFADGLERWSVEGGVVAAWWQGVPCARLTPAGAATALHQSAADMACDWGSLGVGKDGVPLRARVSMRVATDGGCRLRVGLEGSGVDVEAVDVEAGGWLTVAIGGTGGVALSRAPSELVVALERGECRVTDIQVVPDVAVMVGTRLTQTAEGIAMLVGGMAKGLQATDIDIANRKLTVTADSFMVRNNRGEATAAVDADGNLVAGSLKAGGKASVAMGVDGEGKPYLVGTNALGEVVWRLDGNGYVNSTPDVAMAVAGGRAYFANRMDGGYDIRYEVGVRVTNRQLAQVTFTPGGHLGCYIQKSRTEQSAWVALAQKEAVAIASGASGVVTFSGASTVGGSHGAAPAVPFGNGDTLDVRLCYKGESRGVGMVTCGLEA